MRSFTYSAIFLGLFFASSNKAQTSSSSSSVASSSSSSSAKKKTAPYISKACSYIDWKCGNGKSPNKKEVKLCAKLQPQCLQDTLSYQKRQKKIKESNIALGGLYVVENSVQSELDSLSFYDQLFKQHLEDLKAAAKNPCSNAAAFNSERDEIIQDILDLKENSEPNLKIYTFSDEGNTHTYQTTAANKRSEIDTQYKKVINQQKTVADQVKTDLVADLDACEAKAQSIVENKKALDTLKTTSFAPEGNCTKPNSNPQTQSNAPDGGE